MRALALAWFAIIAGVAATTVGGAVAWAGIALWLGGFALMAAVVRSFWHERRHPGLTG